MFFVENMFVYPNNNYILTPRENDINICRISNAEYVIHKNVQTKCIFYALLTQQLNTAMLHIDKFELMRTKDKLRSVGINEKFQKPPNKVLLFC